MPLNEWGVTASGIATAKAEPGRVETTGFANTNDPPGGAIASGSAWTDDFLVQHRDGLTDPAYGFGHVRITVTLNTQFSLVNIYPWTLIFNSARIDWSVLTRDMTNMTDATDSG
jgi:hypothetical protein